MKTTQTTPTEPTTPATRGPLDAERIRADFPILRRTVNGKPLIYLDNAASTQKPQAVIDAISDFYTDKCSNVHRGVHELSARATEAFEGSREKLRRFIGAASEKEVIFTRGTTESINLVARTFGDTQIGPDDEILLTEMEHHSNIVPWQLLCERTGAKIRVVPIDDDGNLLMDEFERLLSARTRLVSVVHASNAIGTRNPVEEIVRLAHRRGARVLLDGAQAVGHEAVDVQALDCDFFAFSGHKMFGPTGIGALYGKAEVLDALPPFQGGGDMIRSVSFKKTTYKDAPYRFEAGTPDIAGAIGLGAAVDYLEAVGMERIAALEQDLLAYGNALLLAIPEVRQIGTALRKAGILSFTVDGVHAHDMGTALDLEGIAVRAGHHCAQPVMQHFKIPATVRASFTLYNTREELDVLAAAIRRTIEVFN